MSVVMPPPLWGSLRTRSPNRHGKKDGGRSGRTLVATSSKEHGERKGHPRERTGDEGAATTVLRTV
jgi:hypothetical protein